MEAQYGAMNVEHSLPNSNTTHVQMYQNSKKELHIIISPKNNNFVFLFY
jgi:hypothetical protein